MFAKNQKFAVVDIETTGTSSKDGDRIMQIGAVFIQNNQIIHTFATNINPQHAIPDAVQRLTKLTPKKLKDAPTFDAVAATLKNKLTDCVFVAHNINFDLPFLNSEFERVGLAPIDVLGVDTVPLAQILLPTALGYRLVDLTKLLKIKHLAPHRADSDARATAELFLALMQKAQQLPQMTLDMLDKIPLQLPRETQQIFVTASAIVKEQRPTLPGNLRIVNGLALQRLPENASRRLKNAKYPATQTQKEKLFGSVLAYRGEQAKLMNLIYNNYTHEKAKSLVIEAPTGLGKTLGYLIPFSYLRQKQVVVAVPTKILQQQVQQTIDEQLNKIIPGTVTTTILKGKQHYLDLTRFKQSLLVKEHNYAVQFLKMRILVWLTITTTGDLDELKIGNQDTEYRQEITQVSNSDLNQFGAYDFHLRLTEKAQKANILIVNHAYLLAHAAEFTNNPYLVVDEAQKLAPQVLNSSRHIFNFEQLFKTMRVVKNILKNQTNSDLATVFANQGELWQLTNNLHQLLAKFEVDLTKLQGLLYREFVLKMGGTKQLQRQAEVSLSSQDLSIFFTKNVMTITKLNTNVTKIDQLEEQLQSKFTQQSSNDRWVISDYNRMLEFKHNWQQFKAIFFELVKIQQQVGEFPDTSLFWLGMQNKLGQLTLSCSLINTDDYFSNQLYPFFQPPLFIGATLFSSSRSQYLFDQLNLIKNNVKVKKFPTTLQYAKQAQLLIASDAPHPQNAGRFLYVDYLARQIANLVLTTNKKTLVLFNSNQELEQVTHLLQGDEQLDEYAILAHNISGSDAKILRKFKDEPKAILLGAGSFWEGIDLPLTQLELLIMTRLPFEAPDSLVVKAQNDWLIAHQRNPFFNLSLPKAILKLRQGFGRLIRSTADQGVAVILDTRILDKQYGKTMLKALPVDLPVKAVVSHDLATSAQNFFEKNKVIDHQEENDGNPTTIIN